MGGVRFLFFGGFASAGGFFVSGGEGGGSGVTIL